MGNNAVSWMVAVSAASTREEAVEIGAEMLRQKIIQRISVKPINSKQRQRQEVVFKDSKKGFYRFNEALIATYLLEITIHEASHLLGKQRNGTSSPFVTVNTVHERCETRIIEDSVNPVWNESFKLAVNAPWSEQIVIRVWNWQEIGADNFLGEVRIVLADIMSDIYIGGKRLNRHQNSSDGREIAQNNRLRNTSMSTSPRSSHARQEQEDSAHLSDSPKNYPWLHRVHQSDVVDDWISQTISTVAVHESQGERGETSVSSNGEGGELSSFNNAGDHKSVNSDPNFDSDAFNINGNAREAAMYERSSNLSQGKLSDVGPYANSMAPHSNSMAPPANRYSTVRTIYRDHAEPFSHPDVRDEDSNDSNDDESFLPEKYPPARIKWYELQKRSERSNVQGDIAISLKLRDWSFSESLRQQTRPVFLGFRCGKVPVPPDNTHVRASRDGSPNVLVKGIPIRASEINQNADASNGEVLEKQGGLNFDKTTSDSHSKSTLDTISSLFSPRKLLHESQKHLISPDHMTLNKRHMMLYRALNFVTKWQLRVNLLGCQGVKHAGMAKDMRVTTALLAVAPPVIRWKNYIVLRLDGYEDKRGLFRRQSKTVTKASGPSWNGEELVIDDIPTPLVGNITLRLYQVIGLEIIHREVGAGSVLLNSVPRQLDLDEKTTEVKSDDRKSDWTSSQGKDGMEGSSSWRNQHDTIDVPLSLLAGLGTMSRVSNGVLRCTMTLTPSENCRRSQESYGRSVSQTSKRRRNPLPDSINPFRSSPSKGKSIAKDELVDESPTKFSDVSAIDSLSKNAGNPLKNRIIDMTVFMNVSVVVKHFFSCQGNFSKDVQKAQQKRQVRETFWKMAGITRIDSSVSSSDSIHTSDEEVVGRHDRDLKNSSGKFSSRHILRRRKSSSVQKSYGAASSPSQKSNKQSSKNEDSSSRLVGNDLPCNVGDYRDLSYLASNQWSVACRVQCRQRVAQYDPAGSGIVVIETQKLPDIPFGHAFVLVRKIVIVYEAENVTKISISAAVKMLSHNAWPEGIEYAIDSEVTTMVYVYQQKSLPCFFPFVR